MTLEDTKDVQIKTIELETVWFNLAASINESLFVKPLDFSNYAKGLLLEIRKYVWSQKLESKTVKLEIKVPTSWWQHLKQDHFPQWAVKKWPVRYKTESKSYQFDVKALFPELQMNTPPHLGKYVVCSCVNEIH
jgi:hypothetical protein